MSDDFGTVNMRTSDKAREIEVIRQHYRRHREALEAMAAEAPTEYLAGEYRRLIVEIDAAFVKLDELEGKGPAGPTRATVPPATPRTEPGRRPLVTTPVASHVPDDDRASSGSRVMLIVAVGLIVLALIGWLIWRASSDDRTESAVVEQTQTTDTIAAAAPVAAAALSVEPEGHDYGVVRKGTRAARQFEVVNVTDAPLSITVARSACRCLYYDYADVIPPNGKETLTVTLDGAKAPAGQLQESVQITSKSDPSIATAFGISATIR